MYVKAITLEKSMMREAPARASLMSQPKEDDFVKAFEEHADGLFRHASFRISNREKAADLTQDTFLKVWDYVREGGEIRSWKSFLYHVLNNLIIDEYRRMKDQSLDALLEEETATASAFIATGSRNEKEEKLDTEMLIEKIRTFIPRLPDAYRTALTLRYIDDFSPKEIASLLGITENVVSVRIHRGVARLREMCEKDTQP